MRNFTFLLFGIFFSQVLSAQWTSDYDVNTLVADSETSDISSIGTADGKTYVIYWDEASDYVLKVQLLDANGNQVFGTGGMVVNNTAEMSTFTVTRSEAVDTSGNVYITFTATGDGHGYAHKISPTGEQLWGASGIDLGQDAYDTKILPAADGGAVIGWYKNGRGNLMKYDADGNEDWGAVKVINSPDPSNSFTSVGEMALLSDGSFIVLMHVKGTSWMINSIFWAQRYAADGSEIWANAVQLSNNTTAFNRRYPVLQDGDVTYLGYFGSTGTRFDSFLQRINPDGTIPWGINGSDFRTDNGFSESETSIAFEEGSSYVYSISQVMNSTQSEYGEYIQKFDKATGARMFTDNAEEVFGVDADNYVHQGDLQLVDGKPFFLISKGISNGVNPIELAVVYLDENGADIWPEQYRDIATSGNNKSRTDFTRNVNGQSVAVWVEPRAGATRAYAQNYKIETETEEGCLEADPDLPQWPTSTFVPACEGTAEVIATNCWTGEYSMVEVTAGTEYIFSSSVASDFITISDEEGTVVYTAGTGTLTWTAPADELVRFYLHLDDECDWGDDVSRSRIVQCGEIVEPTDYCEPVLDCTDGDVITNVTFAGIDNDTDCSPSGYGDYTNQVAEVEAGGTYPISVTVGGGWPNESVSFWVDYNNNYVFDEDEFTYVGIGTAGEVMGDIEIPAGVPDGEYRMRVRVAAVGEGSATWDMACDEEQVYGETEDYTLSVGELGITDMTAFEFTYYPNPVKDILKFDSKKSIESVSVTNLAGQEVLNAGKTGGQIDVSGLVPGVYVFRVKLEGGQVETFKIIKK